MITEPKDFVAWANAEGYDTARTYDTERSKWVMLNPMTADLWKAWKAGVASTGSSTEGKERV
jgi:hypothetical protein